MFGFESVKDVLDVIQVPVVGGLAGLVWPLVQALDKRRRFECLIARELEEVEPYPNTRSSQKSHTLGLLKGQSNSSLYRGYTEATRSAGGFFTILIHRGVVI